MDIQISMKGHLCYTTHDNSEVTLWNAVVVLPVSTYKNQPCIHKYCNLHSWWTAVVCYLTDPVKYDQVLKNLATLALCSVKIWVTVEEPMTADVDE